MVEQADDPNLGPGGVPTPTPEPGPTPTPQDGGGLKPLTALLSEGGKGDVGADDAAAAAAAAKKTADDAAAAAAELRGPAARINKLTAEKWEAKRAAEAAEARAKLAEETLAELARLNPDGTGGEAPPTPAKPGARTYTQDELMREASRVAAIQEYNRQVDAAVITGRAAHPDFNQSIEGLKKIAGQIIPDHFVQAALETGEASELIYELGKNAGEADRILSLPPIKQAVALEKFADGIRAKRAAAKTASAEVDPDISRAPAPIVPKVGGSSRKELELDDPNLPLAEFIKRRNEMEKKARARA